MSSDAPQLENEYELSAVLLHKGSNATSGHYGGTQHSNALRLRSASLKMFVRTRHRTQGCRWVVTAVAQVKNELDGCWWEFNDEKVRLLGSQPSGCGAEPKPGKGRALHRSFVWVFLHACSCCICSSNWAMDSIKTEG